LSRGPGSAQQHILVSVGYEFQVDFDFVHQAKHLSHPLQDGGIPLPRIAEDYAREQGVDYTRSVIESVRRAARTLERKGLVRTDYWWVPTADNKDFAGPWRKMLLVGPPGGGPLLPAGRYVRPKRLTPPKRKSDTPFSRFLGRHYCAACGQLIEEERLGRNLELVGLWKETLAVATSDIAKLARKHMRDALRDSRLCYDCWLDRL